MMSSCDRSRLLKALPLLALATTSLTACDRLRPWGESEAISLLKDGSEQVCVAPEVQAALRKAILPDVTHSTDMTTLEQRTTALKTVSLSYDATTLQVFDKSVSKATCSSTVEITGNDKKSNKFHVIYQITPSADKAGAVVVSTDNADAQAFANDLESDAIDDAVAKRQVDEEVATDQRQRAQLLAIVNDRWLIGTWTDAASEEGCVGSQTVTYTKQHRFLASENEMRWTLDADQIQYSGVADPEQSIRSKIVHATPISFTEQDEQGNTSQWRKCTRSELAELKRLESEQSVIPAGPAAPQPQPQSQFIPGWK